MSSRHMGRAAKAGLRIVNDLPPLPERKNPLIAFGLGLALGAVGVALYFKSAKDFFVCLGLFIVASIIVPGLGSLLGWFFAPCYGAYRAASSNEKLGL
jgi:hypothetical protein